MAQKEARIRITAQDKATAKLKGIQAQMTRLKTSIMGTTAALTGLGGVAGVAGLGMMSRRAIDAGSAITDMATATRTGIEELQVLTLAAQDAGASSEQMANLLVRAQKSANDAARGLSTAKDAFKTLGINAETFINLPTELKLEELGKAIVNSKGDVRAYGSALDLLGTRNAPKLMEVLERLGTEGFATMAQRARDAGQIMEAETAKRLDAAADEIERFKRRATILFGEAIANLMDKNGVGRKVIALEMLSIAGEFGGGILDAAIHAFKLVSVVGQSSMKIVAEYFRNALLGNFDELGLDVVGKRLVDSITRGFAGTEVEQTFSNLFGEYWQNQISEAKGALAELKKGITGFAAEGEDAGKTTAGWVNDTARAVNGLASGLENGLINAAKNGKSAFGDMAQFIIAEIQRVLIRAALLRPLFGFLGGLFPTGNIIGEAFTGAFGGTGAFGNSNMREGRSYIVGERGPEKITMGDNGRVDPVGGGPTFNVDMRGASVEAVARLERFVAQVNGSIEQRAVAAVGIERNLNPAY